MLAILISPYSSTDRALVFGTSNGGSIPSEGTKKEIESEVGAALAAPALADSAAKGKFKSAESRRKKRMKKNAKIKEH